MADFLTPAQRSRVMSRVRGRGNSATELRLIRIFRNHRIKGWRRNIPLFGKPDFVFPAIRVALFVDGCFWHGCPNHVSWPATNRAFWRKKLEGNLTRDRLVNATLRAKGWRVIRVWQHELAKNKEARLVARLEKAGLTSRRQSTYSKSLKLAR
jgi:DNA mismatch endonuclease, patch repair protein